MRPYPQETLDKPLSRNALGGYRCLYLPSYLEKGLLGNRINGYTLPILSLPTPKRYSPPPPRSDTQRSPRRHLAASPPSSTHRHLPTRLPQPPSPPKGNARCPTARRAPSRHRSAWSPHRRPAPLPTRRRVPPHRGRGRSSAGWVLRRGEKASRP